jgi:hypothetical protein
LYRTGWYAPKSARNDGVWVQEQKLLAADGSAEDAFGTAVSIDGDVLVVGAFLDGGGSAYVFRKSDDTWGQEAKLVGADSGSFDQFGASVALGVDTVAVGAVLHNSGAGAAYLFRKLGAEWSQEEKLAAGDGSNEDHFGYSISLSNTTVAVGARDDDDRGINSGSAYVFGR